MDSFTDAGVIPCINFILMLFILAVLLWQTVVIEETQIRVANNDVAYAFNARRIKNEFDAMQIKLNEVAPSKSAEST